MKYAKLLGSTLAASLALSFASLQALEVMEGTHTKDVKNTGMHTKDAFVKSDVIKIIKDNPDLSTLGTLIQTANLQTILAGTGPFTIFAPTNEAFEKLGKDKLNDLMKPENKDKLIQILTYHIVPGNVMAKDVKTGEVKTINGKVLDIKVDGTKVTVDGAKVVKTDHVGTNGVVHVIDKVLIP